MQVENLGRAELFAALRWRVWRGRRFGHRAPARFAFAGRFGFAGQSISARHIPVGREAVRALCRAFHAWQPLEAAAQTLGEGNGARDHRARFVWRAAFPHAKARPYGRFLFIGGHVVLLLPQAYTIVGTFGGRPPAAWERSRYQERLKG